MGELLQFVPRGKPIEIANVQIVGNALCQDVKAAQLARDDPSIYAMDDDTAPIELEHYMDDDTSPSEYCAPDNDCA